MNKFLSFLGLSLMLSAAMAQSSTVTFNLNMSNETVSDGGVYLGGGVIGGPTAHEMTDPDGDGIYSVSISLANGTTGNYTFLNGNCPDWSCKENIAGLPCADPGNYNDRILPDINGDVTISTCFAQCSEDGSCSAPPALSNVTFQVDMGQYAGTFGTVNLNGGFNGWCGSCAEMTDDDGDNIYEITVEGLSGSIEYKFTLDGWTAQEEFAGGEPCTLTTGEFTNRFYAVDGDVTLDAVCWNMCTLCNAEPVPGCTDATACNYNADATEDDGSCVYGEGPNAGFTVMDALCHDGMGSVMLDSATVDIAGATFSVGGMAIENGMMEIAAGTHMLVATGADGCSNETEFTVNAPEELVIEVTLVSQDSGAGDGQASAEVSGGTPDYVVVWTNMTGIEVSPDSLASGLYTAIATDANGCTASASLTMTVDGIEDVLSLEGAVFPVPVVDQLNIRLTTPLLGDATVDVRDMQGRLVATLAMRTAQQHIVIDAASWEAGVYSVQISTEGARASWSFVK
ncbi:MAG TPA: hypothetical protein DCL98_03105 [Flavobacteriales bacterium]|nr:hypothetical protein [Flavobacteriales bacterium]